ncbi:MAG: DNA-3-methyladenine glycosylase 2 family protein [Gemmatimonadales bacterium]|nr:DNA-3-methyladenine glycosylase 2 family protein [Gemmatimonadales bacterium]
MTDAIHCLWDEPGVAAVDWDHVCRELSARDKGLAKVIAAVPGSRIVPHTTHSAFESLAHSIVYQQLSGKAAATIFGRFRALYDAAGELDPRAVLKTPHRRLRSAGLSEAKALAMKDLAAHVTRGAVPSIAELRRLDPDQVVERLTVVRGVGRWTVEMLLLFRLGHPDVLPAHDLGIRKGLARVMRRRELPDPEAVIRRGERWRPWRSVASWFLWRATELPRGRSPARSP